MMAEYIWILTAFGVVPQKDFILKMLFYPFEEQLYFPAIFIEQSNLMCLKIKVVG